MPFAKGSEYRDGLWHEDRGSKGEAKPPVAMPKPVMIPAPNKGK